ncbi:MAG: hypothetical protein PHH19_00815 [Eubacteriales bacterium]|jgi:hypothetical protein|nr:hypothetical protein [Eubacteriales bacterium]
MIKFKLAVCTVLVTTLIAFNLFLNLVGDNTLVASETAKATPYGAVLLQK